MNIWELDHAHRVGKEVQRLRKSSGLTAQQLGDRTEKLGLKMTRQAISDLENGRRRYVTTAELVVLAAALNTSPVVLIYPAPYDEMIEVLPGVEASKFTAAEWFSAKTWFGVAEKPGDDPVAKWQDAVNKLNLNRRLADLQQQRTRAQLEAMDTDSTPENLTLYHSRLKLLDDSIADIRLRLGIDGDA
ncbi:helix-turn-helix domain-containing protein [Mycolicibacterium wolinskyi]|uniref:helix-turn-helix domain-containing protein n=1 Tax=Mycolicibacterium wolinskyi TaxID=59750 RepID=UPI003917AD08